jgi:hypothetical protein
MVVKGNKRMDGAGAFERENVLKRTFCGGRHWKEQKPVFVYEKM